MVADFGKGAVLVDQGVAIANVDVLLAVHEGGNLGDFGEAVFLFDAVQGFVVFGHFTVGGLFVLRNERLELERQFVEEVAGAAGVVDGFGRGGALLDEAFERQTHQDEAADGHGREVLPFALLDALVEKAFEHVAEKLVVASRVGQADVLPHLDDLEQHFGVLVEELFVVNVD